MKQQVGSPRPTAADVAGWVVGFGEAVFARLDDLATLLGDQVHGPAARRSDLAIEDFCRDLLLDEAVSVVGAGAVFAPGLLADAPYWLEWWTSDGSGPKGIVKLAAETDPRAIGFRDYTTLPWYVRPCETGRAHVTGPYVDYLCTDQYTLTFTRPLVVDGAFAGVVGVDVLVAWFEGELLREMEGVERTCIVVNAMGRVVTSSDPAWVTGDMVRELLVDDRGADGPRPVDGWMLTPCGDLPMMVLSEH